MVKQSCALSRVRDDAKALLLLTAAFRNKFATQEHVGDGPGVTLDSSEVSGVNQVESACRKSTGQRRSLDQDPTDSPVLHAQAVKKK